MKVPKEVVRVEILVSHFRIEGNMFVYPGARLLDIVNIKDTAFIPITDAKIYTLADNRLVKEVGFIGVNRNAVSFFYPVEVKDQEHAVNVPGGAGGMGGLGT